MSRWFVMGKGVWQQAPKATSLLFALGLLALLSVTLKVAVFQGQVVALQNRVSALQQQLRHQAVPQPVADPGAATLQKMRDNRQRIDALVPPLAEFSTFHEELFVMAKQAGVEIDQISYQPELDDTTGYWRYRLGFSLTSDYAQVKKFLFLLEGSSRLIWLDQIGLSGAARQGRDTKTVSLRIALTTFFKGAQG